MYFRNLDGTGTLHYELKPNDGTLTTRVTIKTISHSGGMIIEGFDVLCTVGSQKVYTLTTVFGFFPKKALENQIGLNNDAEQLAGFSMPENIGIDLTARPTRYFGGTAALPAASLCMLDRITCFVPDGGSKGLGFLRGEKEVDPSEWFFKAHFFQDPVQPGSLGLEAMLQLLQFYMLHTNMDDGFQRPRFLSHGIDIPMKWKYRGQVVPQNQCITTTLEIVECKKHATKATVFANASLWIDGRRIYEARQLSMEIIEDNSTK